MSAEPIRVLFLCTGNSARSVLAEAVLRKLGAGRFEAFSAGSTPTGRVNPYTVELLQGRGYPVAQLRSKSWNEFAQPGAPRLDIVITVCDNAAGEVCPVWPGRPTTAHWGFEDPAACGGTDDEKRRTFEAVYGQIHSRIEALVALPLERMSPEERQAALRSLAEATR